jgi:2-keto-3-deoxy-L-rhamnonate aldolase RhmA
MGKRTKSFRKRLRAAEPLVGTFMKTPSPIVAEILSLSPLDVFCIDTEHAPFGPLEIDGCLAAFRGADAPSLVRVAADTATEIRVALDAGATGILVPHVTSAEQAERIVKAAHFGEGGRGFAGSPRAAAYGTLTMDEHLRASRDQTTIVVQIEDLAALPNVSDIAKVDGIDCLFVGRADLSVAMGKKMSSPEIIDAVSEICAAARAAGTAVGMYTPNLGEIPGWRDAGASLFLLSSDQTFILSGASALADAVKG